jgi:LacI family transcriptional regulator
MAELDYVPNPMAKAFRSGRSPMISLAVPDLLDPFFAAIVRAADEEAARAPQVGPGGRR